MLPDYAACTVRKLENLFVSQYKFRILPADIRPMTNIRTLRRSDGDQCVGLRYAVRCKCCSAYTISPAPCSNILPALHLPYFCREWWKKAADYAILTNVKIFQFPHGTCRIIGQHALCGKENLVVSEYNIRKRSLITFWFGSGLPGVSECGAYIEKLFVCAPFVCNLSSFFLFWGGLGHIQKKYLSVPRLLWKRGSGETFFLYMPRNREKRAN